MPTRNWKSLTRRLGGYYILASQPFSFELMKGIVPEAL